ncbi:Uncharacterised protein [Klebsiella pneumoniae]|nr:Uncharacterised protein [Klebsiella pneumoniae]
MEQERGQQRKARSEQRGGPGQETEQNRQTAAELKEDGQRQQRARDAHGFHILLGSRITGDFAPSCSDKQNRHQNTRYQYTNIF